jgi:hypothetical protein
MALLIALLAAATAGSTARALEVLLSTRSDAALGTLSFEPEDPDPVRHRDEQRDAVLRRVMSSSLRKRTSTLCR